MNRIATSLLVASLVAARAACGADTVRNDPTPPRRSAKAPRSPRAPR